MLRYYSHPNNRNHPPNKQEEERIRIAAVFIHLINRVARNAPFISLPLSFSLHFQTIFFITAYLLPLLLIIGLYSIMLHRLWNQASKDSPVAVDLRSKSLLKS